jgi:hypothetical protein
MTRRAAESKVHGLPRLNQRDRAAATRLRASDPECRFQRAAERIVGDYIDVCGPIDQPELLVEAIAKELKEVSNEA